MITKIDVKKLSGTITLPDEYLNGRSIGFNVLVLLEFNYLRYNSPFLCCQNLAKNSTSYGDLAGAKITMVHRY